MTFHVHDSELNKWAEIVNKEYLKVHKEQVATSTELGHVKVDDSTLKVDSDGTLQVSPTYLDDNLDLEIADVKDLQTKLDEIDDALQNVTPSQHEHDISDITGLQTELDDKAEKVHTHVSADITDLEDFVKQVIEDNVETPTSTSPLSSKSIRIQVPQGSTSLPINIDEYNPTDYLLFLFDNTTKVFGDTFTIEESTVSTSGFEVRFLDAIDSIEDRTYEVVIIGGVADGGTTPSPIPNDMIHVGLSAPTNTSMAWVKE